MAIHEESGSNSIMSSKSYSSCDSLSSGASEDSKDNVRNVGSSGGEVGGEARGFKAGGAPGTQIWQGVARRRRTGRRGMSRFRSNSGRKVGVPLADGEGVNNFGDALRSPFLLSARMTRVARYEASVVIRLSSMMLSLLTV